MGGSIELENHVEISFVLCHIPVTKVELCICVDCICVILFRCLTLIKGLFTFGFPYLMMPALLGPYFLAGVGIGGPP